MSMCSPCSNDVRLSGFPACWCAWAGGKGTHASLRLPSFSPAHPASSPVDARWVYDLFPGWNPASLHPERAFDLSCSRPPCLKGDSDQAAQDHAHISRLECSAQSRQALEFPGRALQFHIRGHSFPADRRRDTRLGLRIGEEKAACVVTENPPPARRLLTCRSSLERIRSSGWFILQCPHVHVRLKPESQKRRVSSISLLRQILFHTNTQVCLSMEKSLDGKRDNNNIL